MQVSDMRKKDDGFCVGVFWMGIPLKHFYIWWCDDYVYIRLLCLAVTRDLQLDIQTVSRYKNTHKNVYTNIQ